MIDSIKDDIGIPNKLALERMLEWFAGLPRKLLVGVLTGDPDGRDEMLLGWYKDAMANAGKSIDVTDKNDISSRLRLAHLILNEIEMIQSGRKDHEQDQADARRRKKS